MTTKSIALTEAEVAQRLSVSAPTLRSWRHRGVGPVFRRFGRAVRYMERDVDRYVEMQAAGRMKAGDVRA
jgi:excisionase family DNA binding protein